MATTTRIGQWSAGLAGMALCLSAGAAAVGSGSITGLTFTLVDLDANDGVSPSLNWSSPFTVVEANRSYGQVVSFSPAPGGGLQWSVNFPQSDPTATTDDVSSFLAPMTATLGGASASIGRLGLSAQASANAGESQNSVAYGTGSFQLSANTELRVTATLTAKAIGPGGASFMNPAGTAADFGGQVAQALGYAELFLGDTSLLNTQEGASHAPSTNLLSFPVDAFDLEDVKLAELSVKNDSTDDFFGTFYALVQASAMEVAPLDVGGGTVPLPATLPLVLLALGAGAAIRRR